MSIDSPEFDRPSSDIDRLNARAAQLNASAAQLLCEGTVELVYDGVKIRLTQDQEQHAEVRLAGYPAGTTTDYFVKQDFLSAPRSEGAFVRTFCTKIDVNAKEYVRIHVPAGDKKMSDYEMPPLKVGDDIDTDGVSEVYIEHHDGPDIHWYAVMARGIYEYIPYAEQDEDSSVLSEDGIWRWVNSRISESAEKIAQIQRLITNGKTVHQLRVSNPPVST